VPADPRFPRWSTLVRAGPRWSALIGPRWAALIRADPR